MCDNISSGLKREAFLSYDNYNFSDEINNAMEERDIIKNLQSNEEILIQKSDEGNSVVEFNRDDYITRMNGMLSDTSKLMNIDIKSRKEINYILKLEDRLECFLKG